MSATVALEPEKSKVLTAGDQTFSPSESASSREVQKREMVRDAGFRTCNPYVAPHRAANL